MKYNVFGLGNPLIDVILQVPEETITKLDMPKGSMNLVDALRQAQILEACVEHDATEALGGSCANTMVMISQLGGTGAYCGNAGDDHFGNTYAKQLEAEGVTSYLSQEEGVTGSTVILVTPDAERTMNTHLGKCQDLKGSQINLEAIGESEYLYIEGYLWDTPSQQEAVMKAVDYAKANGVKIALSLSDPFCVERNKEAFQNLCDNYVDLLFCNETEAKQMTGLEEPFASLKKLGGKITQVALTIGARGAMIWDDGEIFHIEPTPTEAVDTTGAGDAFAAGYLFGVTNGYLPEKAGALGAVSASIVVGQIGPRFKGDFKKLVSSYMR